MALLCVCVCVCVCVRAHTCSVTWLCLTLCDSVDCSLPGSSVHGISQVRILEWVAISSTRRSSRPRDWTCISCVSCIAGGFFLYLLSHQGKPILLYLLIPSPCFAHVPAPGIHHSILCFFYFFSFWFSSFFFLLNDSCFIEFYCFLSNLDMNQPWLHMYISVSLSST